MQPSPVQAKLIESVSLALGLDDRKILAFAEALKTKTIKMAMKDGIPSIVVSDDQVTFKFKPDSKKRLIQDENEAFDVAGTGKEVGEVPNKEEVMDKEDNADEGESLELFPLALYPSPIVSATSVAMSEVKAAQRGKVALVPKHENSEVVEACLILSAVQDVRDQKKVLLVVDHKEKLPIIFSALVDLLEPKWEAGWEGSETDEDIEERMTYNRERGGSVWSYDQMEMAYGANSKKNGFEMYNFGDFIDAPQAKAKVYLIDEENIRFISLKRCPKDAKLTIMHSSPFLERKFGKECSHGIFQLIGPLHRTPLFTSGNARLEVHVPASRPLSLSNELTGGRYGYLEEYQELVEKYR